jgi:polyisoprenoid-binding protein YceI
MFRFPRQTVRGLAMLAMISLFCAATTSAQAADTYKIDPAHASFVFRAKHLDTSYVYGRFDKVAGTFDADEANPDAIKFDITVQAASVDTNVPQRDNHLRSSTFFDVKEFPTLTFKSSAVKKTDERKYDVTGDLTIHGVTKTITVPMEFVGKSSGGPMGNRAGWATTFTINRSDYGMNGLMGPVGDEVTIMVSFEGVKQE